MILVCGEALMDVYGGGSTPTGMALDARVGGSPLNVAVGLARLGQPVAFFGGVSSGFLGQRLMQSLHDEGVQTQAVWRSHAPTTLSLVGLSPEGLAEYAFYGEAAADRMLPLQALAGVPREVAALHVGSYTCVVPPAAQTLIRLVQEMQGRALVSYDPNVRLGVEPDLERWRSHLQWMLPRTQLLKLSEEDLQALHPGADADLLAEQWLSQGVRCVVLTRGAAGVSAWTPNCSLSLPPSPANVVDTVGAGDTFQAALLAWAAEQGRLSAAGLAELDAHALKQALQFACKAAAITCTRRGADMPRRAELG